MVKPKLFYLISIKENNRVFYFTGFGTLNPGVPLFCSNISKAFVCLTETYAERLKSGLNNSTAEITACAEI